MPTQLVATQSCKNVRYIRFALHSRKVSGIKYTAWPPAPSSPFQGSLTVTIAHTQLLQHIHTDMTALVCMQFTLQQGIRTLMYTWHRLNEQIYLFKDISCNMEPWLMVTRVVLHWRCNISSHTSMYVCTHILTWWSRVKSLYSKRMLGLPPCSNREATELMQQNVEERVEGKTQMCACTSDGVSYDATHLVQKHFNEHHIAKYVQ